MSLDALAPDQRAVVQLVLQQDRSYDDLAGLLGITAAAVRERAHRGLERLAPGEALSTEDRAQVTDYLLGQQSVSGRESTRTLLTGSQPARSWAHAVSAELAAVARSPLPEIPAGTDDAPTPDPEPTEPVVASEADPLPSDPAMPTRARPRPRQRAQETTAADFGFSEVVADATATEPVDGDEPPSTSRIGAALLIAGLAILVAALIVWLVGRGDDEPSSAANGTTTEEATPSAPAPASGKPQYQALGIVALKAAEGETGTGRVVVYGASTGEVAINVEGKKLAPNDGDAYGLWLTGGEENHFLGFTTVAKDGRLRTSGPQESDITDFATWLTDPNVLIVVSRETEDPGDAPSTVVLQGSIDKVQPVPSPAPTAAP